jgi:predicted Na+-dependent transporter
MSSLSKALEKINLYDKIKVAMSLLMGLLIDLKVVYKIIKMPIPVLIGIFCQYACMPMVSLSIYFYKVSI